ncbi:MAG: hypothetical protein NPIRA05_01020 [Nitrospirales bacterium]|nr:MAG: hypothetical protein NPIRA05_01020 [Nitrospirales bacterium]GJL83986.1 MAG: hypothetical protein DHS20C01_36200 [marine bacterium B5-7]
MANGDRDTLSILVEETGNLLMPLREAIASPATFITFMARMGWGVDEIPTPIADLASSLNAVFIALERVRDGDQDPATIEGLRKNIRDVYTDIRSLRNAQDSTFPSHLNADNFKAEFPTQLAENLVADYLTRHYSGIAFALRILGLMRIDYQREIGNRPSFVRYAFRFTDLADVIDDPALIFQNAFGWGTDDFKVDFLFDQIENLLITLRVAVTRGIFETDTAEQLEGGILVPGDPEREAVTAVFLERQRTNGRLAAELRLIELPGDDIIKPGFAVMPSFNGVLGLRMQVADDVAVTIDSSLNLVGGLGLILRPEQEPKILVGFGGEDAPTEVEAELKASIEYQREDIDPTVVLGHRNGSRLEFQRISGRAGLSLDKTNPRKELFVESDLQGGKLVISAGEGDQFLQKILPKDGIETNFELTLGFSNVRGFYFGGSGGVEIQVPVHLDLGLIEVPTLTLGFQPTNGTIPINLGADIKANLGPLTAVVENLGLIAKFSFPDEGGNLGPLDVDIGFKPPTGVGLSLDGGGFKGGGFLKFERDEARYVGILELEFQNKIALKAIGLLTTRLPDDESGFSLLILITAEFTPIQLGYGFTLNGVGGLLGLNRTMRIERLRTGIRDNTLSSILFPPDPVANASRIISDLRQVFPPQSGRFVFGPMGKLGWGTPTLITLDLGLALEMPEPVTLALLGVLKAQLPDEEKPLLKLQVNFLGIVDFQKEQLSFDATIYDSKLLTFPLAGDMAVRLNWGADPNFLLTVGGFHPAYKPPAMTLPPLKRMTVQLLSGNNPRLTLESYFAITSNTVQFGAMIELYAGAGSFNVYGILAFDTLFRFSPFYFVAEIKAMLALRRGSKSIASIGLALTLEGTTPWKAKGTATLKLCWFIKVKVRFTKTFGQVVDTRLDDLNVLPLITMALKAPGNWEARLPARRHLLVSLKDMDTASQTIIAHPLGVLSVSQKVVPLNVRIDTVGHQHPRDGNEFRVTQVLINGQAHTPSTARESFAPAQFFHKSDEEKLSSQSFEQYDSGIRLSDTEAFESSHVVRREVDYELSYIDSQRDLPRPPTRVRPYGLAFQAWAAGGTIARSPLSHAHTRKSALAPQSVRVEQESFAVVTVNELAPAAADHVRRSEAEALRYMKELIAQTPGLTGRLQTVPAFELN